MRLYLVKRVVPAASTPHGQISIKDPLPPVLGCLAVRQNNPARLSDAKIVFTQGTVIFSIL